MSAPDRRAMLDRADRTLSLRRQCALLGVARSGVYRPRKPANDNDAALMRWAVTRSNVFYVPIDLQLAPGAMSRDGFHPGEPVYRACGESIARFVVEKILPGER